VTDEPQPEQQPSDPRLERLRERCGGTLLRAEVTAEGLDFLVAPETVRELLGCLQEEVLAGDHGFSDLCGVEREDCLEAIYRFFLPGQKGGVTIRAQMPKDRPVLPTIADLYAGAAWPEREIMEMFGIQVTGHPDPRKLLLPQDWEGYPLRKDYRYPSEHPYLSPDPLREDPVAVLGGGEPAAAEAETQEP